VNLAPSHLRVWGFLAKLLSSWNQRENAVPSWVSGGLEGRTVTVGFETSGERLGMGSAGPAVLFGVAAWPVPMELWTSLFLLLYSVKDKLQIRTLVFVPVGRFKIR
jgi:hypothetical protein